MKSTGQFSYKITADIALNGLDLAVLEYCAKHHYDGTCQAFFDPNETVTDSRGFTVTVSREREGNYWLNEWRWQDWKARFGEDKDAQYTEETCRHPSEHPEFEITVAVSGRTLDLCMKILERLGVDETWEFLEKFTGHKMPEQEKHIGAHAAQLRCQMLETFRAIEGEWMRLNRPEARSQ